MPIVRSCANALGAVKAKMPKAKVQLWSPCCGAMIHSKPIGPRNMDHDLYVKLSGTMECPQCGSRLNHTVFRIRDTGQEKHLANGLDRRGLECSQPNLCPIIGRADKAFKVCE